MRVALAQLAPVPGDVEANLERLREVVRSHPAELYVFPELFLSGYRIGDQFHRIALSPGDPPMESLRQLSASKRVALAVGAPIRHARAGEVENAVLLTGADGSVAWRGKRFLPTHGPFEEGATFTPASGSSIVEIDHHRLGVQICYDAFFPEVSRELAFAGAEILLVLSAAPVTSRRLFDRVLPARAVENAVPLVYVNRVGVEDGIVFGGGSQSLDARGENLDPPAGASERGKEAVWVVDVDLGEAARWRPFRPVLRDIAPHRTGPRASARERPGDRPALGTDHPAGRTGPL
ncbi:MAG: carbon-nitrogen hydrolase family protein [Thermoplasmata archaeon]|nr:carbon-nitrogen hydrolase family protein [Thermoplasmata archaeon]